MSDVTMEQRLKLVKQIRSRYNEDQYDLSNRERILYGKTSRPVESLAQHPDQETDTDNPVTFFRVRLFIAVLLLAAVIVMDRNGTKIAGITAEEVFRAISADYEDTIDRWAEALAEKNSNQETDFPGNSDITASPAELSINDTL